MIRTVIDFQPIYLPYLQRHNKAQIEGYGVVSSEEAHEDIGAVYVETINKAYGTALHGEKTDWFDLYSTLYLNTKCIPQEVLCCPKIKLPLQLDICSQCYVEPEHCLTCGTGYIVLYSTCETINHNIPFIITSIPQFGYLTRDINNNIFYHANSSTTGTDTIGFQVTNIDGTTTNYSASVEITCAGTFAPTSICSV